MDGFSGYTQIKMDHFDTERTIFGTPMGNFYYIVVGDVISFRWFFTSSVN